MLEKPPLAACAVLHVALNPITGPWSVMRDLAVAQANSGRYCAVGLGVITSKDWPAQYKEELIQTGLPTYRASTIKAFGTACFLWQRLHHPPIEKWIVDLKRKSGAGRIVVHFHNAWMSGVFLPLQNPTCEKLTTVATFHGMNAMLDGKPVRRFLHRWMAMRLTRFGARLTSVDRSNLTLIRQVLDLEPNAFTVVPNGVADDPTVRAESWSGEGYFSVGHVGSITERKGWRIGAEAAIQLASEGIRVRYIIAGDGPDACHAVALCKKHPKIIEYLGHVSHPRRNLLPKLHALSVMSTHEGLPMTIIEAMSAGVPVVATAVGGIPEAVTNEMTGFLIPRNVSELMEVLRRLYESPKLCKTMSARMREKFAQEFEISHIVQQYDIIYNQAF